MDTQALPPVEHVVVVMFENRSFDNVLGWAYQSSKPRRFIPSTPLARFNGLQGLDLQRYANPVQMGTVVQLFPPTRGYSATTIEGVSYLTPPPVDPHEAFAHMTRQIYGPWSPNQPAIDDGNGNVPPGVKATMIGFAADYADALGKGAPPSQIAKVMETGTYAQTYPFGILAHAYAASDAWYGAAPTQTNPNRAFMACGTSQGLVNNAADGIDVFTAPTIWNRLQAFGKTWRIYWENTYLPDVGTQPWTRQCFSQLADFGDEYFPRMGAFHRDARLGRLPFFSFIEPSWTLERDDEGFQGDDLHPPGDIRPGLQFLSAIYSSLVSNQQAWAKTLLVVTFDEHGGTWDHVPPPTGVVPDMSHPTGFRFDRVGPRVPTVLVSPLVEPGTVFRSTKPSDGKYVYPYDHTSIAATVLTLAGIPRPWKLYDRVEAAPTFEGVLTRASAPRTDVEIGEVGGHWDREAAPTAAELVTFGAPFHLRYASAGPYEGLYVTADSPANGNALWLTADRGKAFPFRFTSGYSGGTAPPAAMFVRTTGLVYLQYAASWAPDARNESYVRVRDEWAEVGTYCYFGPDDGWWYSEWYVENCTRPTLGWGLTWGSEVTLAYHALNATRDWLPRKIVPLWDPLGTWVAVGGDAQYDDPTVGRWTVARP